MPVRRIREPRSHRLSLSKFDRGTYIYKALSEHENERNALRISPVDLEACRLNEADVSHEASTTLVDTFADDHALPIVSFPELLPITSFNEDKNQQAMIWADCYRAHFRVWDAGCKFMAIGVHNLMANPDTNRGILIDLDLPVRSIGTGLPEHSIRDLRIGYIPFMSLDLLNDRYFDGKLIRLYRHDAESFIWAMTWLFFHNKYPSVIEPWSTADDNACRVEKGDFLSGFSKYLAGHVPDDLLCHLAFKLLRQLSRERYERNCEGMMAHSSTDAEPAPILTEQDLQSDAWAYFQTTDECIRKVLVY